MPISVKSQIDFNKIETKNLVLENRLSTDTPIALPHTGQMYFETDTGKLKIYNVNTGDWEETSGVAIVDVNTLPTTDIKTNVIYRIIENGYNYGEDFIEEANVICYSVDGTVITISATGLTDNTNTSNPVTYTWENLTDAIIESFGSNVEVVDFVKDTNHFCKYDTDKYDIANEFTETTITELYHNIDGTSSGWNSLSSGGGGGTNNYNDLIVSTMPKINGVTLKGNKTTEQLGINPDTIIDVETLPITDIKDNVFYRVPTDEIFKHNGESYSNIVCFQCDSDYVTIDATGITDTYSGEEPVIYTWENLTDDIINFLIQPITVDEEEKYPISITDFSKDVNHFCKYGDNLYDTANNFTKTFIYQLFSYVDNSWVNNSSYNFLSDTPNIDNVRLTENTTRQDIKLIGEDDIKKDSEFINPKSKGIDIVLNTGTSDNPNIINDDPAYKYANNKTSSNNYINTRLETIERKADAKTLTKFVDALPANPDINTEYYVETSTPNVYNRYFVDSIGTVKEIGNTEMDVSTLATKTELNLKEDLSNKTTTLDDNSTNTQYPSAKSVVDYVKNSGSSQIVETILWQSPNGTSGTSISGYTNITLTDKLMNYELFEVVFVRSASNGTLFFTKKDLEERLGITMNFTGEMSYDEKNSYVNVGCPSTLDTNILTIRGSTSCNLCKIVGYKTIPMINTYSREIRELIMNTPKDTTGTMTLTKGMSNYDYLDIYWCLTQYTNDKNFIRVRVSDFINIYNSSSSLLYFTAASRYIQIYRTNDTTINIVGVDSIKIETIYGVKAEPVVVGDKPYKQLYFNQTGVSSGSITLNDDMTKFTYLEIIGKRGIYTVSSKIAVASMINQSQSYEPLVNTAWENGTKACVYIIRASNSTTQFTVASQGSSSLIEVIGWY